MINFRKARKGQFGMLEYIILALFMVVIVMAIVFFLFGWEFGVAQREGLDQLYAKSLSMISFFSHSDFFTEKDNMLDDSKLMVAKCEDIEAIFGQKLCINITSVLFVGDEVKTCSLASYPDCNHWTICQELCGENLLGYDVPVNIYRRVSGTTELGILDLRIGVS